MILKRQGVENGGFRTLKRMELFSGRVKEILTQGHKNSVVPQEFSSDKSEEVLSYSE